MPRMPAATWSSQGRTASSRAAGVEFSGEASPRVRHSSARPVPARRKAYSSPPRSADSWPGRASTTSTLYARGSHPAGGATAVTGFIRCPSSAPPHPRGGGWSYGAAAMETRWTSPPRREQPGLNQDLPGRHDELAAHPGARVVALLADHVLRVLVIGAQVDATPSAQLTTAMP